MSSVLRPKKKKVLSAKRVWKGITNTPRACLDTVIRYIRQPSYCFLSGQGKRSGIIMFMQEEEQRDQNPRSGRIILVREQQKMEGINIVKPAPEAASSSSSSVSDSGGARVDEDHSIFDDDDDSIKRNNYYYKSRERFQLEKLENSTSSDHVHVDDSIFEDFIQRNRERFRLEKQNSLERLNYYALWPYYAYFDPDY